MEAKSGSQSESMRKRRRRLKRAVRRGSLSRIRRVLSSDVLCHALIDAELDSNGRGALHIACKRGHHRVALWLLKHGASCRLLDPLGNTPLHLAVQRFVEREVDVECRDNGLLVLNLIRVNHLAFYSNNSDGQSPEALLQPFMKRLEENCLSPSPLRTFLTAVQCCLEQIGEQGFERIEEERWNSQCFERLLEEQEEVDGAEWRFSQEYPCETYYERLDRLGEEVRRRRRQFNIDGQERERGQRESHKQSKSDQPSHLHAEKQPLVLKPLVSDKTLQAAEDERLFQTVLVNWTSDHELLGFDDIPWPSGESVEAMVGTLLHGIDPLSMKAHIRALLKRWHPDKFMQKFQECLKKCDHQRILEQVTKLSQALTKHVATS